MRLPHPEHSHAVLIGTSDYSNTRLPDLPAVAHNLSGLAAALTDTRLCGLPSSHVTVIADASRPHSTGVQLTAAAEAATDLLLIYLSGHMLMEGHNEPALELAAPAASTRRARLGLNWVKHSITTSPAATKILIVDGHLTGDGTPHRLAQECAAIPDTATWVYCTADDAVYNQAGAVATRFTGALLDVILRSDQYHRGLDLDSLHYNICYAFDGESLPRPALAVPEAVHASTAAMALFRGSSAPPTAGDLQSLATLAKKVAAAQRHRHLPDNVVQALRSFIVASQRVLGPQHPETLGARQQLAYWTGLSGDPAAAVQICQRLLADQNQALGPRHADTQRTYSDWLYWSQQPVSTQSWSQG
jgi:hypothetical protein